jgi:SAM-dependent methyltransferase
MANSMSAPPGQDESLRRLSTAGRYNAWLLDRARPFLGAKVLDVGAGIGTFSAELARIAEHVVALEPDVGDAEQLRRRFEGNDRVRVEERDAASLAGVDVGGPFDAAVCFNVLEHIPDDVAALASIGAQLRRGGHLLLLVPAHRALFGEIDRSVGHVRRYDRDTLVARLRETAYEVVEARYVNPLGAVGWLVSARLFRRKQVPEAPLRVYDRVVPLLRALDGVRLPFGLSVWAVAKTDGSDSASAANA